jgi:glucokinase
VEALASGPAIARAMEEKGTDPHPALPHPPEGGVKRGGRVSEPSPRGRGLDEGSVIWTAEKVDAAARAGDARAVAVMAAAGSALGRGIGAALALINPQRVIVGGGVGRAGAAFWDALQAAARAAAMPGARVEILPAALGDDAPLWGMIGEF